MRVLVTYSLYLWYTAVRVAMAAYHVGYLNDRQNCWLQQMLDQDGFEIVSLVVDTVQVAATFIFHDLLIVCVRILQARVLYCTMVLCGPSMFAPEFSTLSRLLRDTLEQ